MSSEHYNLYEAVKRIQASRISLNSKFAVKQEPLKKHSYLLENPIYTPRFLYNSDHKVYNKKPNEVDAIKKHVSTWLKLQGIEAIPNLHQD